MSVFWAHGWVSCECEQRKIKSKLKICELKIYTRENVVVKIISNKWHPLVGWELTENMETEEAKAVLMLLVKKLEAEWKNLKFISGQMNKMKEQGSTESLNRQVTSLKQKVNEANILKHEIQEAKFENWERRRNTD